MDEDNFDSIVLPSILYKFRSISKYTEDIIVQKKVYFASPDSFNDPFDCKTPISFEASIPEMKAQWVKVARKFEPKTKISQLKHRANLMFRDPVLVKKTKDFLYQSHSKHVTNFGVFCLSERCDSILMWSHYADCHKGICIGFDTTYFKQPHIQKVEYSDKYPKLNYYKSSPEEMDRGILFSKSEEWAYEREWRIVVPEIENRVVNLSSDSISSIIFGCNCSKDTVSSYAKILKEKWPQVTIQKAIKRNDSFSFDIIPCDIR